MPQDFSREIKQYVAGLQDIAKDILKAQAKLDNLTAVFTGGAFNASITDALLQGDTSFAHLTAAQVTTVTANLGTIKAAITATIQNNLAHLVGAPSISG